MLKKFTAAERAEYDNRVAGAIEEHGCFVLCVSDPDCNDPPFAYSVGIALDSAQPEIIVFGLSPSMGGWVVNEYNRLVRAGKKFKPGVAYKGFLRGFPVYIEPARPTQARKFMFACNRLYADNDYPVVQVIIPSTDGVWPWEKAAPRGFRKLQPLLCRPTAAVPRA